MKTAATIIPGDRLVVSGPVVCFYAVDQVDQLDDGRVRVQCRAHQGGTYYLGDDQVQVLPAGARMFTS